MLDILLVTTTMDGLKHPNASEQQVFEVVLLHAFKVVLMVSDALRSRMRYWDTCELHSGLHS